jgi:triacylglycerol lipase
MSPARRRLLQVVAVGVALLVAVLAAVQLRGDRPARGADQQVLGAVLLVPGFGGTTEELQPLASALRAAGRQVLVVSLPDGGTGDLRKAADAVAAAADSAGTSSVDLVGYSAGGVVARLYAAGKGATRVRRVVTLGSPHHGTKVAALANSFAKSECPLACEQLVPGSSLLGGLEDTPPGPLWVSVWSSGDEVVTPPDSARLKGGTNVVLQGICPGIEVSHGNLPTTPLVMRIVLQELTTRPVTSPRGC